MSGSGRRTAFAELAETIHGCRRCPRLVQWREHAADNPPKRFRDWDYWRRPVSGFGDPDARMVIVGLAPAAHGANRTGRVFTGDRSGDWLYASLHRTGYANQPESTHVGDGLKLTDAFVSAVNRCAPPANKPAPGERDNCLPYLERELRVARQRPGCWWHWAATAGTATLRAARALGLEVPRPKPRFGHGVETQFGPWTLLGCFHVSQQNTFTGKLTEPMTDEIFNRAREICDQEAIRR